MSAASAPPVELAHTTAWRCDACDATGQVEHPAHADVYTMVNRLTAAHRDVAPDCREGIERMKVWRVAVPHV